MTPSTSANLDRFLSKYEKDQTYFLAPGHAQSGSTVPDFNIESAIACTQLHVRPAWEIGENDPDIIGVKEEDKIIIPPGVDEAPVLRMLKRIKARRASGRPNLTPQRKVGRNEPCPCGSGKKFKKCHGK